jgi:hemoglobin-like flavoprotein
MLQQALVSVVEPLDDASWLSQQLGALGAKHADDGVTRAMFDWVGEAVLAMLADVLADDWDSAAKTAWSDAYAAIRDLMPAVGGEAVALRA